MGNGCLLLLSEFFSIAFRASLLSSQHVAAVEQNHGQKLATPGLPKARRWWRKQRFAAVCSSASWHLPSASVLAKFSVHCSYQRYLSFAKDCELLGGWDGRQQMTQQMPMGYILFEEASVVHVIAWPASQQSYNHKQAPFGPFFTSLNRFCSFDINFKLFWVSDWKK